MRVLTPVRSASSSLPSKPVRIVGRLIVPSCSWSAMTSQMKRPASPDGTISPPPLKRKVESTTTSKAVSSFFTPRSQKPPEKQTWKIIESSLVVGHYDNASNPQDPITRPVRVAAFDLDDTLIKAKPGVAKYARTPTSHTWWDTSVPDRVKQLHEDGWLIIILTNQKAISLKTDAKSLQSDTKSLTNFKTQVAGFLRQLDFPTSVFAATEDDIYRKPRTGMWREFCNAYGLVAVDDIDLAQSFYVGDAAGREKDKTKDHSTCDRDLAANIGIKFRTPEEFFLDRDAEPYVHPFEPKRYLEAVTKISKQPFVKKHDQELVIFCGSPGAGKSSFYWKVMQPQGYERINQDILKSRDRCLKVAREHLEAGQSVAVDNTNRDIDARAHWVKLAQHFNLPIRCIHFTADPRLCEHNATVRAHNRIVNPENRELLPGIAFRSFVQSYIPPQLEEGFEDITDVAFEFEGTEDERAIWSQYWVTKFTT